MEKMYKTIDDDLLEKIETITDINYEYKQDYIPNEVLDILKDLVEEYNLLKEEYDEDKEKITKIYKEKYPFNNQNFNINFEHDDLEASFHFSSDNMIDILHKKIIFNPLLFLYSNHHDFSQKEIRKAPIEFTSPFENIKKVTVKIPDNYRIENIPKSKKFKTEDDGIIYSYNIYVEGNNIIVESSVKVDSDSFPKEYYPAFKQIFDVITQYEGQLVTVVKK